MPAFGTGVDASLGRIDYTPYLQGSMQGSSALGKGIASLGESAAAAMKEYGQNKQIAAVTNAKNEALLMGNPEVLNDAPESVKRLISNMQKNGASSLKDGAQLAAYLETAVVQKKARKDESIKQQTAALANIMVDSPQNMAGVNLSALDPQVVLGARAFADSIKKERAETVKLVSEAARLNYEATQNKNGGQIVYADTAEKARALVAKETGFPLSIIKAFHSPERGFFAMVDNDLQESLRVRTDNLQRALVPKVDEIEGQLYMLDRDAQGNPVRTKIDQPGYKAILNERANYVKQYQNAKTPEEKTDIADQLRIVLGQGQVPVEIIKDTLDNLFSTTPPPTGGSEGTGANGGDKPLVVGSITRTPPGASASSAQTPPPPGPPPPGPPQGQQQQAALSGAPTTENPPRDDRDAFEKQAQPPAGSAQPYVSPTSIPTSELPVDQAPAVVSAPPAVQAPAPTETRTPSRELLAAMQEGQPAPKSKWTEADIINTISGGAAGAYALKKVAQSPTVIKGIKALASSATALAKIAGSTTMAVGRKVFPALAIAEAIDNFGGKLASIGLPDEDKMRLSEAVLKNFFEEVATNATEEKRQAMKSEVLDRLDQQMRSNRSVAEKATIRQFTLDALAKIDAIPKDRKLTFSETMKQKEADFNKRQPNRQAAQDAMNARLQDKNLFPNGRK